MKKPFFAKFLEKQVEGEETEEKREEGHGLPVQTDLKAGRRKPPFVTLKYPSDDDEYPVDL
jgi:hypothetical protein